MTAEEVAKVWQTRAQRIGPALRNEMRQLGQRALQLSRLKLRDEIYSKPEDLSPTGRPKWRRTGHLLLSEELREDSFDSFTLANTAVYAEPRHEAGKPGHRKINPERIAHWHDDTLLQLEREMPARLERLGLVLLEGGE